MNDQETPDVEVLVAMTAREHITAACHLLDAAAAPNDHDRACRLLARAQVHAALATAKRLTK